VAVQYALVNNNKTMHDKGLEQRPLPLSEKRILDALAFLSTPASIPQPVFKNGSFYPDSCRRVGSPVDQTQSML